MKVTIRGGYSQDAKDKETYGYNIEVEGSDNDKPADVAAAYLLAKDRLEEEE